MVMAGSKKANTAFATASNEPEQQNGSNGDLGAAAMEAGEQIQEQVVNLTQQVRQQATDQLMSQKERAVDTLDTVALLLHQAGEHAHQQDKAMLAGYVDKAAGQVGQWSETLRDQDMTQLVEETKQFARRQPMLFVGTALAAGFLGARFLRSSTQQPEQSQESTVPAEADAVGADLPPYDIDQSALGSTGVALDTTLNAATTRSSETTPEVGGFLEDYEGAVREGEQNDATSLTDTDDVMSPEKL